MTKEQLLTKFSPADIYFHYLKINKFPASNISSPFSDDKNPSFKLYKNNTFKCFSSGKQGDVWQFVSDLKNIDCKKNFNVVLKAIVSDLGIINIIEKTNHAPTHSIALASASDKKTNSAEHFLVETTELKASHVAYWKSFGVSPEILQAFSVSAVKRFQFWQESKNAIKKFPIFEGVLAFAYKVNNRYEIYIPEQSEKKVTKFFYNGFTGDDIFGLDQIPADCENLIIAAGIKDCLVLNAHGFPAVSFRSENHYPTNEQIELLNTKSKHLFICYDNDFTNPKNPGQAAQKAITDRFHFIHPIFLPAGTNDVAELYYKGGSINQSFQIAVENITAKKNQDDAEEETKKTIFHIAERYLTAHYKIRYNSIKLELQICHVGTNDWKKINENSLFIEMQKKGINISIDKLVAILKSDYTQEFNPVNKYFNTLPSWHSDQTDHIAKLAGFVKAKEPAQFLLHFKKWLVRAIKCATNPEYFNKQALIFVSPKQNDGKSTFCRFLCPQALSDYIAEDITNDKDARILLCRNFLINLDELAVLSKQEINSLKAFFSKTQINERLPYDRTNSIIPRIASFIGSTNQDEFLADETGSVRWLCFSITGIDWNYKKEIDINRVWAQACYLALDEKFECELTREDIIENEKRNRDFQILSIERELIHKSFRIPDESNFRQAHFLNATEIMQHLIATEIIPSKGLNKVSIGRAMKQEGYERDKQDGLYGYFVIPIKESGIAKPAEVSKQAKQIEETNPISQWKPVAIEY